MLSWNVVAHAASNEKPVVFIALSSDSESAGSLVRDTELNFQYGCSEIYYM